MATELVTNDPPGNADTMHSAAGANLIDSPDRITDAIMVKINPVLQMRSMTVGGMMDRFEEVAPEQNSELAGINLVVSITFGRDQFVTTRLGNNELVHLLVEVAIQPASHRALFHRQDLLALDRTEHGANRRDARWHGISCHDLLSVFDGEFCIVAVHVGSNVICCHGDFLSLGLSLSTVLYLRMPGFSYLH